MALNVDSIGALQAFVLVAEARSFKVAGQALGLTSSAVGKAIARLEGRLSVQLFHRTTRTVSLTAEGTLFLPRAKAVLEELEAAEAELSDIAAEPGGRMKVGLPVTGAFLTGPISDFVRAHPRIRLELDFSDRLVDVVEEGFDAVIRTGAPSDSRLMHRRLGGFDWHLAAAPAYLDRHGRPGTVADLAGHVCLRQRLSNGRLAPWTFPEETGTEIPASLVASIIDPLVDMACAGAGIGAFPAILIAQHLEDGRLEAVLPGSYRNTGTLHVLWPAAKFRATRTRAFVDFLADWARKHARGFGP